MTPRCQSFKDSCSEARKATSTVVSKPTGMGLVAAFSARGHGALPLLQKPLSMGKQMLYP